MKKKLLLVLVVLAAVAVTVSVATGSGPAPQWVKVADGAYQAAAVAGDGSIAYVPASTRLMPPVAADTTPAPEVVQELGGFSVALEGVSPDAMAEVVEDSQPFVYCSVPSWRLGAELMGEVPGGWSARLDGHEKYLLSVADRLDNLDVATGGQVYVTRDQVGALTVRGLDGEPVALRGLPKDVLDSARASAWSFDGSALYLAEQIGRGAQIWLAPLAGQATPLARLDQFDEFVGSTPQGVLVYQSGMALTEVTAQGTRTVSQLASLDPWVVSPDARYVLMLDRVVTLTSVEGGQTTTLRMPRGYELCAPHGWPGPSSSEIVAYASGRDPSDTVLLWYSEEAPGRYTLRVVEPPSGELCFDYSVDPVVVGPDMVSVVLTDRSAFVVGSAVDTGTWLIHLEGVGGR